MKSVFSWFKRHLWILILAVLITAALITAIIVTISKGSVTLWDWMELLFVPIVLAVAAIGFQQAGQRRDAAQALENQREASLHRYFDTMTDFILNHGLLSEDNDNQSVISAIASARTLSVLRQLDGPRKALLLGFLKSAGLINRNDPRVFLYGADLSRCRDLPTDLEEVSLFGALFDDAQISECSMQGSNLEHVSFRGAEIDVCILDSTDLGSANFNEAIILKTEFKEANLSKATFERASLSKVSFSHADLTEAFFLKSKLRFVRFDHAVLQRARFSSARLDQVTFLNADLTSSYFFRSRTKGVDFEKAAVRTDMMLPDGTAVSSNEEGE